MSTMFWIWMAAAVVFLIIELLSPTFVFGCFVVGCAAAGVFAYFSPDQYYWQIGIFIVVTIGLLPVTKLFVRRISNARAPSANVDRLKGSTALVIKSIDPDLGGQVKLEGEVWSARSPEAVPQGHKVRVVGVAGTHLEVEPMNQEGEIP